MNTDMKTIYNTISRIGFLAVVGFSGILSGCSNDFDFDEARRENPEFAYKETFEKAFGTIDPNQSWDFTTGPEVRGTRTNTSYPYWEKGEYVTFQGDALTWLKTQLPEGSGNSYNSRYDHRNLGTAFVMTVPKGGFKIIPIFQGGAGNDFEVHMVIEKGNTDGTDIDIIIWNRSHYNDNVNPYKQDDIQYRTSTNGGWQDVGTKNLGSGTSTAQAVRSKPLIFGDENSNPFPAGCVGKSMYFYLRRRNNGSLATGSGYPDGTDKRSSKEQFFLSLTCPYNPNCIGSTNGTLHEYKMIGFEMNRKSMDGFCDWDLNEGVFIIEGLPKVPQEIEVRPGGYTVPFEETKRYMVEDLGATEKTDIDFNDIVVDFSKTWKVDHSWETINDVPGPESISDPYDIRYSATVRALGGTKNISIFIGTPNGTNECIFTKDKYGDPDGNTPNVSWNGSYSNVANLNIGSGATASIMYNTFSSTKEYKGNTDKNYVTTDAGSVIATINLPTSGLTWNPETNNIFVKVYDTDKKSSGVQSAETTKTIVFPANGTVPYMIAVPKTQVWNKERASVFDDDDDENFIKLKEKNNAF